MFKVLGIQKILENLLRLAKLHSIKANSGIRNVEDLKQAYRNFLIDAQPNVQKPNEQSMRLVWEKDDVAPLLKIFQEDSALDDFESIFDAGGSYQLNEALSRVRDAIKKMREVTPLFATVIDLVIHTIFSFPSKCAGGGSTSAAIGCIWVDLRPHWSEQDILEFLVHETIHNLVFIDELCYTHYTSYADIANKNNFARSAILNKLRPLDKVFHSILVSAEVLLFRQEDFGHPDQPCLHPPTEILLEQTYQSIKSIQEVQQFLTPRAQILLRESEEKLKAVLPKQQCEA